MTIILLEGCDGVGKTTFANELSKKTGYEVLRGSSFEISELGAEGMFNHMMELLDKENVIIDRFMWSNIVYGNLFDYPLMTANQYDALIDKLDSKDSLLVYLYAPIGTINYRIDNRGDDKIKKENINEIVEYYNKELYGQFRPKIMLSLDTSIMSVANSTDVVTGFIK